MKRVKVVKRYKLLVIRIDKPWNVRYNMVTVILHTVLHSWKLLREEILKVLITKKKE